MENEEAKRLGILGVVSKCAGAGIGTIVAAGGKVTGTVKNLLTRPVDDFAVDLDESEQAEAASQRPTIEDEIEGTAAKADELVDNVTSLEAELVETRNLLAEAKSDAEKTQSDFASQLATLQTEKESLIFDLEQSTKEVNHLKSTEAALRARVAALESEIDIIKSNAEKPHSPLIHAKPLLSEVDVAQIEQDPDISERITAPQDDSKVEAVIDEQLSKPLVDEPEISVSEDVEEIKAEEEELPEQDEEGVVAVQSDGQEQIETEAAESGLVIAETSSLVPADVKVEEVNAADFDSETEKIIFINALSGMSSPDKATRVDAVKVMAGIGHELSVRALIGQMAKEPTAQIRVECIKSLTELNMKEGLPAIQDALSEQEASIRLAAVRGLYRLSGVASARQLIPMLCDENEDVRRRTVSCIGWLGKEELAVELVPLLDDNSVSVRLAVVEAMGNLRSRQVVAGLINHLNDPEKIVSKAIISTLEKITGKKMSRFFPRDENKFQILISRWRQWCEDK